MNYEKQIWELFKLNRDDLNKADKKIEKILIGVFNEGKKVGKKETIARIQNHLKTIK